MSGRLCRDCGHTLEPHARGCPRCALNLEAESMIDRFIWLRLVPTFIVVVVLAVVAVFLLR